MQTPALPAPLSAPPMGNIPGSDTTHPFEVAYATGGKDGRWDLSFEAFDVQAREVRLFVNWEFVGTLAAGPDGGWTGARTLTLPASALRGEETNVIVFAADGRLARVGRAVALRWRATTLSRRARDPGAYPARHVAPGGRSR